jgi:four helix bundle protein
MAYRELKAYKKAFELSMEIFEITKAFPKEEKYSLIDQIRRSSRSVCSHIAEAYRKRHYEKHFISIMTSGDSENTETQVWLDFSVACKYLTQSYYEYLSEKSGEVGKLISFMINNPEKFGVNCNQGIKK